MRDGSDSSNSYVMTVSAVELALEGNLDMFVKSKKDKVRFSNAVTFELLKVQTCINDPWSIKCVTLYEI